MTQQPSATAWRPDDDVSVWSKLRRAPMTCGGTFEETLHTLNAAVHLLTTRVPLRTAWLA